MREQYVAGSLFSVGDEAVLEKSDEVVKIATLGANYVIVETTDGMKMRKWLKSGQTINRLGSNMYKLSHKSEKKASRCQQPFGYGGSPCN